MPTKIIPHYFFIALSLLLFGYSVSSCNTEGDYDSSIYGQLRNGQGYWLYLVELQSQSTTVIDSVQLDEQGDFEFNFSMSEKPQFYFLRLQSGDMLRLLIQEGERVEINANTLHLARTYVVANSPGSRKLWELQKITDAHYATRDSIYMTYRKNANTENEASARLTDSLLQQLYKEHYTEIRYFVEKNQSSLASIFGLYSQFDQNPVLDFDYDYDLFASTADALSLDYPESSHAIALANRILDKQKEEEYANERERLLSKGGQFPDITLVDQFAQTQHLSQLKSEVVLLYFWNSQNKNSWRLHEELKALHKKYKKEELQIMGVGVEKDKLAWKNTVALDQLPWINVLGKPQMEREYNLTQLPRVFLMDSTRIIYAKDIAIDSLQTQVQRMLQ